MATAEQKEELLKEITDQDLRERATHYVKQLDVLEAYIERNWDVIENLPPDDPELALFDAGAQLFIDKLTALYAEQLRRNEQSVN